MEVISKAKVKCLNEVVTGKWKHYAEVLCTHIGYGLGKKCAGYSQLKGVSQKAEKNPG